MTFRTFENGIRIAKGFASDPVTGKIGEIYWNTTRNVLRQCVNDITPVWEDVTVKPGTTQYSVLVWDIVADRWVENTLLLINGKTVYSATSATPEDLTIQSGDTTGPGEFGSDLVLKVGTGLAGDGNISVDAENVIQKTDKGTALNIQSADSTVNAAGNNLNLTAGTGTSTQGDVNASAENINLTSGSKIRLTGEVVLSQILVADPALPETAQIYFNNDFKRFRKYDGTNWHWFDINGQNIPTVGVDLFDDSILSLPPDTTTPIDGVTVTDGMLVVIQNSGSPVIYRADVSGIAITWVPQNFGQSPTVNPEYGDCIYVKNGTTNIDSVYFYQSTNAWVNPFANAGAVILAGITTDNLTRWDGIQWVPDTSLNSSGSGILYARNDSNNDSNKAQNVTIQASNKTAGTGDGGDLNLNAGASVGGNKGDVRVTGNTLIAPINSSSTYNAGGLYADSTTEKLRVGQNGIFRDVDGADINGELTGFEDLTKSSIAFTDGTLQFDLNLSGVDPIVIWIKGVRYSYSSTQSVVISNTVANHYIYFDATGTLVSNTVFNLQSGLKNFVLVAIVNWNGSASTLVADRRHLLTMDGDARYNKRNTQPIEVKAGDFEPTGNVFTGSGSSNILIGAGNLYIEELVRVVTSKDVSLSQIPMLYLSGTNVSNIVTGSSAMLNNGFTLVYNLNTLGTWSQEPIFSTPSYFNIWIAVTTDPTKPVVMIQPQNIYSNLTEAAAELPENIVTFWPSTEYRLIHRLTFVTSSFLSFTARKFVNLFDMTPIWSSEANLVVNQNSEKDYWARFDEYQDIYFNPVTGEITWTNEIIIAFTGKNTGNTIFGGSVTLSDGQVAIVDGVIKTGNVGTFLTPTVVANSSIQNNVSDNQNIVVLFKRIGNEAYFMRGTALKIQKRIPLLNNQVTPASIFDFPNPTLPNYSFQVQYSIYRGGTVETGIIFVVRGAIGNIGQSIVGASNGSTGVTLNVAESGSTLQLQYTSTNTGNVPVIRYDIKPWLTT